MNAINWTRGVRAFGCRSSSRALTENSPREL
jgi:hypothetical protein